MTFRTNHQCLQSGSTRTFPFHFLATLLASSIALAANLALLSIASAANISAAQGRPIPLVRKDHSPSRWGFRLIDGWSIFPLPVSQAVFDIVTGWVMAIVYALVP
jgi:hypothetical protein